MQALIDDARKAIESGRADEGVTLADRALAMDPKSARAYNIRAYGRLQRSNYAGAIADCDKALALLPGLVGPYLHRAIARKRTGDFNGAMQDYAAAIEQYEAEALYHREKGFELQAKNDTGGAAKEGEAEQQARDDEADAFYSRAIALFDTGRYEQSLVDFDQAINLSPLRAHYYSRRAVTKDELRDVHGAIADATKEVELVPNRAWPFLDRAYIKARSGDLKGALEDDERALQIEPDAAWTYLARGVDRELAGDVDGAFADFTKAIELHQSSTGTERGQKSLAQADASSTRLAEFDLATPPQSAAPAAYRRRGVIKFRRGDLDGALEDYNKAIAFGTTVPNVFFDRGNVRRIKNDLKGAIEDYTQALKFDSRIVPAYVDRAIAYAGLHDYNHALEDVDRAADIAPDEPTVYSNRGSVHELRGEVEKAAADYRRYTELQPANNNGWLKLAVAEFRLKQWLNAAQHAAPYCDGKFFDRATFWGFAWLARIRAGDKAAADRELIKRSDARQPQHEDHSALEVVDFLLGREPETTLLFHSTQLNTNDDKARRCVALYYCGVKRLVEGDQTGGLQRFRECVQLGQTGLTVHVLAQFELSQHQP